MSSDSTSQPAHSTSAFAATVEAVGTGSTELRSSAERGSIASFLRSVAQAPPIEHPDVRLGAYLGADNRYLLTRVVGRGGMGTVYEATDTLLGRSVALKLLDGTKSGRSERALNEARIAASLEHQRIARVYDVGSHDGDRFVAMELVRGVSLRSWMNEQDATQQDILMIARQVAEGLAGLHAGNVIHGDLKPENVMLAERGGVKLLDFGLARYQATHGIADDTSLAQEKSRRTQRDSLGGTPGYMAPEQYLGVTIDARADIFAFGVIMFELVSRRRPFHGQSLVELRRATLNEQPTFDHSRWKRAPSGLREITSRALALDPASRFADGSALLDEIERSGMPQLADTSAAGPTGRRSLRRWVPVTAVGASLLATGPIWSRPHQPSPQRIAAHAPEEEVSVNERVVAPGRTAEEPGYDCTALGAECTRESLTRKTNARSEWFASFALDRTEVTNLQLAATLSDLRRLLRVDNDRAEPEPRYVRWKADSDRGEEVLVDLEKPFGGIEYLHDGSFRAREGHERLPAIQVSRVGAQLHCTHVGKRLANEDEWEAAADSSSWTQVWLTRTSARVATPRNAVSLNVGFRCAISL